MIDDTVRVEPRTTAAVLKQPDSRIFAVAAQRAGASPGQCVYVGDAWNEDARAARRVTRRAAGVRSASPRETSSAKRGRETVSDRGT